ncbi:fungal-specific transcription factor domain-containing protein [Aspergillus karnatakaensis]|uniref:uncharacterized protein n=1 Tax=Aspergillus karnatakaensis TaxID=1810916 RepID=UPI003CCD8E69
MAAPSGPKKPPVRSATACTECQRRKQKAKWPCNHCQARKIAHLCKYAPKKAVRAANAAVSEARESKSAQKSNTYPTPESDHGLDTVTTEGDDRRLLGYLAHPQNGLDDGAKSDSTAVPFNSSLNIPSEMEHALRVIPPKPYTDILVQHFLDNINHQYNALYPPAFMNDFETWWSGKATGVPPSPEFTCLLLRVCACAVPYTDEETRQKLESELGESAEHLSMLYHKAAKQLSSTIAPGKGGLTQLQQLFLTAQWFKTEALFVDAWHALGAAIHEAQELGMHRSSSSARFSDFDREMRRRLWCILYTWDWQMSLLLSRPFIINSSCCDFEFPDLRLEVGAEPDAPSPITHMVLQCQLGLALSKIPEVMGGVTSPTQALTIQQETEKWFESFPPVYSISKPDTRWDDTHSFVKLQRFQLTTIGYMMMLMPLKQCLTKHFDPGSSSIEKGLQVTAVENALRLLRASDDLLKHILPVNAKFHFAPFLMFDTAALLCSAIVHDTNKTIPQREQILEAISQTLTGLSRLSGRAKTGLICYRALKKLVVCLPLQSREAASANLAIPQSSVGAPPSLRPSEHLAYPEYVSLPSEMLGNEFSFPTSLDLLAPDPMNGYTSLSDLPQFDMGELSQIWDWESLDMDFTNNLLF